MITAIITDYLTDDAKMIREEVFIKEQNFTIEFDEIDNKAWHLVAYDNNIPIACCRFFKGNNESEYIIGRIAVLRKYRGQHIGAKILRYAEDNLKKQGVLKLILSAQLQAFGFYTKQGFIPKGETYFEEYCEHMKMEKHLMAAAHKTVSTNKLN